MLATFTVIALTAVFLAALLGILHLDGLPDDDPPAARTPRLRITHDPREGKPRR